MASGPEIQQFNTSWQQTASWAQSKGIKYNQYYPVFQLDSQRLLQYGASGAMSQAERERAIEAAANPNSVTQSTPSTAPNPGNIIHNTITDARNIFTGLGDIIIHPLHNGLADSVKNTWDLIDGDHHLQGMSMGAKLGDALTSTVLSWIPGAMDIGNVLKVDPNLSNAAGAKYLAEHPISSILDIAPLMKFGGFVKDVPATESAAARSALERTGMTPKELAKAGPFRLAKGMVMNKQTGTLGPLGLMTVGDKFHAWSAKSIANISPAIGDMMSGGAKVMNHWTNVKRAVMMKWDQATEKLTTPEQVEQLSEVFKKAEQVGLDKAMEGDIDPLVRNAAEAFIDQNQWIKELSLNASDGPRIITNIRTGAKGLFSLVGHKRVIVTRDAAQKAEDALLDKMPEAQELVGQRDHAAQLAQQELTGLEQANGAARAVHVEGNYSRFMPGWSKRFPVPFGKRSIIKYLFGTGGWVDHLIEKAKAGDWETVEQVAKDTLKRLDKWGVDRVNVEELPPEFKAVRDQVQKLSMLTHAILEIRKRGNEMAYGKADHWTKETPFRDERHRSEAKALGQQHQYELNKFRAAWKEQIDYVRRAFVAKRKEINTRYAKARSDREHAIADGTDNINARYALEKTKLKTRHLLARESRAEWARGRRALGYDPQLVSESARIAPGGLGSEEAIQAGTAMLEAARAKEIADLVASYPSLEVLGAKQTAEIQATRTLESESVREMERDQYKTEQAIKGRQAKTMKNLETENFGKQKREGKFSKLVDNYHRTQNEFSDALFKLPSDNLQPVWTNLVIKNLVEDERARGSIAYKSKVLAEKYGWTQDMIDQLHTNKQLLAQLVQMGLRDALDDPIFEDLDRGVIKHAENLAYQQLDELAKNGLDPYWVHHPSATQVENDAKGSAGIRLIVGKGIPHPNVLSPRTWGLLGNSTKFDVQLALDAPTRSFMSRFALQDFVSTYADHHVVTARTIQDTLFQHKGIRLLDENNFLATAESEMGGWNLEEFDPQDRFGFRLARWGEGKVYMDKDMIRAIEKLSSGDGLLKGSFIEKGTKLFRYSILGLSPRYTAHILFGGTMLLALREPLFFLHIPQMLKDFKEGNFEEGTLTRPSNMGTTEWQLTSKKDAISAYHYKFGEHDTAHHLGAEHIEVKQGVPLKNANPVHWLKALADLNLDFTTTVTHMQQGLAYIAGHDRALAEGMTEERAVMEGMKNISKVYGDLRRMSPFERDVARTILPFYGWQKHILQYVFSFPGDHPWRAMMLANMAEFDISTAPGGLPSRYQFLSFLGSPDAQGNVTAFDLRAINPLRDTANYATWAGLFSSLNPAASGVLAAVNPEIIYGSNTLYPNLTYDQFYGVKEAGAQGNLLTAAEQFVPQIGGMQSALQLVGQRQGMNDSQLIKSIGNQLNFPWVPQTINIRQEAARTAIDQYQVTKQLAATAWQTGNFGPISDLGAVPDPRNADYETPVSELQQLYGALAKEYPGQPPSTTAPPLPSAPL